VAKGIVALRGVSTDRHERYTMEKLKEITREAQWRWTH
jgi:hypothetical protein